MGQVTITLNGRSYRLRCGDGEEARLIALAQHVESKIAGLIAEFGQVGDERLLVMTAIMIADELFDARDAYAQLASSGGDPAALAVAPLAGMATPPAPSPAPQPAATPYEPHAASAAWVPPPTLPHPPEPPIESRPGEPPIKRAMRRQEARAALSERLADAREPGKPLVRRP